MKKKLSILLALVLVFSGVNFNYVAVHAAGQEFDVNFNVNGGEPAPSTQTIPSEQDTINEPAAPEKDGYLFIGWKVKGTDNFIDFSEKVRCLGNELVEYYAKDGNRYEYGHTWLDLEAEYVKTEPLKVTFNTDGGSSNPSPQTVNDGEKIKKPEDPVKDGYVFQYWSEDFMMNTHGKDYRLDFNTSVDFVYNAPNGYNGVNFINSDGNNISYNVLCTNPLELVAIYKEAPKTYQVKFAADGGTPEPSTQTIAENDYVAEPQENPSKEGHEFLYWAVYEPVLNWEATEFDFANEKINSNITLKAIYKQVKTYKVTFDTDGGTPVPAVQHVAEGMVPTIPPEKPTKDGLAFDYWAFEDGEKTPDFTLLQINEDLTLKAVYKEAELATVRFDTRGGTPQPETQQLAIGDKVSKPSEDPSKDGYEFIAWEDAEGSYDFDAPVERDMILYAKYQKEGESHERSNRKDIDIDDKDYDKAIMNFKGAFFVGRPDGTFKPDDTITRGEMATVFAQILGLMDKPVTIENKFSDIDGHWARNNILKVAEYGLIAGYPDGRFDPEGKMKRGEIASIINKYWQIKGFVPNSNEANISDIKNHWAKKLILSLYNHRFVDLDANGKFYPNAPLKRADVAQILNRITDRPLKNGVNQRYKDVPKSHWAFIEIETASSKVD